MECRPTVSIIVPNYNYAGYLRTRIESILAQTYQDFELILLDDASTDNSAEILEYYRNCDKVTICDINAKNTGSPFLQWKKGVTLSQGKYIWIAESDDFADEHFLETAVELLDAYPDAALCFLLELGWLMGMVISLRKSTTVGHGCNGIRVRAMEFSRGRSM